VFPCFSMWNLGQKFVCTFQLHSLYLHGVVLKLVDFCFIFIDHLLSIFGNRVSSVGIATGCGWTAKVRFSVGARDVSLLHSVLTGSEAQPSSNPMVSGAISPYVKQPGREADHWLPSSTYVKYGGAIPPLLHTSSLRGG
jgi:hypothetical protein